MKVLERGINLIEVGEGWLNLGGDGQGLEIFQHDMIAKMNAPGRKDRVDASCS